MNFELIEFDRNYYDLEILYTPIILEQHLIFLLAALSYEFAKEEYHMLKEDLKIWCRYII